MRTIAFGVCLCVLVTAGCGGSPDGVVKKQIALMNEIATAMEQGASQAELDQLQSRGEAIAKEFEGLGLTDSEKQELLTRHQADISAAAARLQKAMMTKAMESLGEGFPGLPPGGFPSGGFPGLNGN
ncbi:hypothetical protein N9D23_14085 [Rubripirellula sp.]|nr:hypothetical protein [Planctomycetaceae bacterium]MDA9859245.1 hypothetical protein [Rubripirellula sp.]MDF1842709.1 hypothetical protein [Rubripirellula sp.]